MPLIPPHRWNAPDSGFVTWKAIRHLCPTQFQMLRATGTELTVPELQLSLPFCLSEEEWQAYLVAAEAESEKGEKGKKGAELFWRGKLPAPDITESDRTPLMSLAEKAFAAIHLPPATTAPDSVLSVAKSTLHGRDAMTPHRKSQVLFCATNQDLGGLVVAKKKSLRRGFPGVPCEDYESEDEIGDDSREVTDLSAVRTMEDALAVLAALPEEGI